MWSSALPCAVAHLRRIACWAMAAIAVDDRIVRSHENKTVSLRLQRSMTDVTWIHNVKKKMPMKMPMIFQEYVWLVNTIRKYGRITLADINNLWVRTDMSGGQPFSRTTFNRIKWAIRDIFGIHIGCDARDGYCYYIENGDVLTNNSVQNWMINTISVNNIISESLSLEHRILLENIPYAGDLLQNVIEAMRQSRKVRLQYKKYVSDEVREHVVEPYCIKLFHRRWYLLAKFAKGTFGVLSFDRIVHLSVADETFEMDGGFNAEEFFYDYFGVYVDEAMDIERVVLRAYDMERFYMRDLPLHPSQREIGGSENYADFECRLKVSRDFKAHLMSRGAYLQVLEPASLVQDMRELLLQTLELYPQKR